MSESGKEVPDKGKNVLLNDILKGCALAVITGLVGTYLSVVFAPVDFEVFISDPKVPDLNLNQGKFVDNSDYFLTPIGTSLNFSFKNITVEVEPRNNINIFSIYLKKYPHRVYLNSVINNTGINIVFTNPQDTIPFKSHMSIVVNKSTKVGEYEAEICGLGGDGKKHCCPVHMKITHDFVPNY